VSSDNRNINDLIALIERNKVAAQGEKTWYNTAEVKGRKNEDSDDYDEFDDDDDEEEEEPDYSDVRLLVFATPGPFTESLFPMIDQHELVYAVTDIPEEIIDIAMSNMQIRHVLIDMDKPSDPTKGVNIFSDLKTLNPNIQIFYCTRNPSTIEARSIQTKGAKLIQKPVLRKTVDQFITENFNL
jgi:hypothetical protein